MTPKLTCVTTTFNEAARIKNWVVQATMWADLVLVFDKQSTDSTRQIASAAGALVIPIPYSKAGHEDTESIWRDQIPTEWAVWSTPSEILKPKLAQIFRTIVQSAPTDYDVVYAPTKLYAFGAHSPTTPFGVVNHPRLINRTSAIVQNEIHNNFIPRLGARLINYDDETYVLHQTHEHFEKYIEKHIEYALQEVRKSETPTETARKAMQIAHKYDYEFSANNGDVRHQLAWKIYHYLVALGCHNKTLETEIPRLYEKQFNAILLEWKSANGTSNEPRNH
jgi:hypothetical protein